MLGLNRQQRLHFFKNRIELKTDGFDISEEYTVGLVAQGILVAGKGNFACDL